jgi:hypothetical protein
MQAKVSRKAVGTANLSRMVSEVLPHNALGKAEVHYRQSSKLRAQTYTPGPSALVEPDGRVHGSAVSPLPGASASARECRVLPPSVSRPSGPQAPPENLLPGRNRSAAVQQALPLLPLLLNVSLLVPPPQASKQPSEKDAGEDCKSKQDRGAHGILPFSG